MDREIEMLHARLLSMMKDFHQVCVNNGIVYYLMCGTALGAQRHKGFIPWDDDVDICVPREDYQRLRMLPPDALPNYMELRDYRARPDIPTHFMKVIDKRTTVIESSYQNNVEGIYIDIFPMDGALEAKCFQERLRSAKIWYYIAVCMYHSTTDKKSNPLKELLKKWARTADLKRLHEKIERLIIRYPYQNSEYCRSYLSAYGSHENMPKSYFGEPKLYPFEDAMFYGPENMDGYLKKLYGNYEQLPPEHERVARHNFVVLDFETPFHEFEGQQRQL